MGVSDLSLKKKLAFNLIRQHYKNENKLHKLKYIMWECTLRCNLACRHCGSECKTDSSVIDMPKEDFFRALDEIRDIIEPNKTMIVLTGGEALMRNDIEEIGLELYRKGFPWGIVSNGLSLTEKKIEALLKSGLRSITLSLDGLKESHNWLRGNPKSFSQTWQAARILAQIPEIRFDIVTCVSQRNFAELKEFKDMHIDGGVKEWRIFTIFPIGRAKELPELQLPPDKFKQLFDFIKETRKEGKIRLNYGCEGYLGSYELEVRDTLFHCKAGINIASVLVDGSISACPDLRANFIQGNIYKDNFRDVWENRYQIFRDKSWTKQGVCSDCKSYKYCQGNGMHLRQEASGELLFCHLKRIEEGEKLLK